jgi:pectinesterase
MRLPSHVLPFLFLFSAGSAIASDFAPSPLKPDLVVATDGSGDFKSIHDAVQSIPRTNRERKIILVKAGVYTEQVRVDAACVTLRGESRAGTRLEFSRANTDRTPGRGQAVLNLSATAHDFVLENFTIENTHGQLGIHAFTIFGLADRTVLLDSDILSHGNDTLSLWRGRAENQAAVDAALSEANPTGWREAGRYYHARLNVRGSVDFICPRGWCFMRDSTITQMNPRATAAIWHDGANNPDKKFVLRNCTFDGPPDWYLARRHHDAHFYLLDCTFSATMRDKAPYRVIYPLDGGSPSEADKKRNADYDRTNVFGERAYYHNSHRTGGDYAWHRDNLATAPGAPQPNQITAAWTFANSWDPERTDAPRIVSLRHQAHPDKLIVTFSEVVTVRGKPRLVFPNGDIAHLLTGSGTPTLEFSSPNAAFSGTTPTLDLNGGAIFSTEAGASIRLAALKLP